MKILPSAKALDASDMSDSILVSFKGHWEEVLLCESITGFIRKRLPRTVKPKWVYAYFGSPFSRVSIKVEVKSIEDVPVKTALGHAAGLHLSPDEIRHYCFGRAEIGLCLTGRLRPAKSKVTLQKLRSVLDFFPPQSFLILSKEAKATLDSLGRFQ